MNGLPRSKEGGISPSELANMLRKSADIVDRKEFHPLLYQTMRALTSYAGEYADGGISTATAATTNGSSVPTKQQQQLKRQGSDKLQQQQQAGPTAGNNNNDPPGKKTTSVFADVPDSILDGGPNNNAKSAGLRSSTTTTSSSATNSGGGGATAAAERVGAPGGQFASASAAAGGNKSDQSKGASSSSHKGGVFSLKGIKKGIEKLGTDVHKFVGELEHQVCLDNNSGIANNKDDVPFDEYAWCDEHFTRGCACKTRNAHQKSESSASIDSLGRQQQQQQQQQGPSLSDAGASSTTESPDDKPSKPCFQRPINPSSNLIANGWIEQQRRSKMRVVWKDVLASLVEGRRPGEETTLWIQRQVINAQTGKVTGLEALHQIPMKWLEDVNYVDLYGDHRFTLKVYNIAEEFYFRTRDESSAQSWVVTLRSARDASLESTHRMEGGVGGADADEEIINNTVKASAKEMGLDDVEDWDLNKQSDQEGGRPQAGSDSGGDSRPSSAPQPQHQSHSQQQQQQQQQQQPRLKISELRAIAHGAGYDTRGMERQDLERIAAHVRGGAAAALPTSPDDNIKQSMQREKEMREAEQRAAAERREREMQEEARVEKMRRDREETERRRMEEAAEQQRRRQQEFEAQAAEIKRKQEEERQRKMAELRAQQQAQQQQYQQAQAEEQRRRAQAQHQAHIPSPPVSGGQTNFQSQPPQWGQPQQAYHQQQQAWQQQQQQQHFQHQGFNRTTTQNHAQQAWQQQHQQHAQNQAWQQQQHQQQQQQQQQRPPQPPPNNTQGPNTPAFQSKYAKQMENKDDEDQSAATLQLKRSILINWALQPPNLNVLRPIDQLITTIHKAMPPAYGVAAHAYFAKFTPIAHSELVNGPHPDETKMKKAVRKVRVFLHPDKLPRDLSSDQAFMARMLWDITSDSWEEFQKHKDELDWIRS